MNLNILKCNFISFHYKNIPITFFYNIFNIALPAVTYTNHLGIMFESNLIFNLHITQIIYKSSWHKVF